MNEETYQALRAFIENQIKLNQLMIDRIEELEKQVKDIKRDKPAINHIMTGHGF